GSDAKIGSASVFEMSVSSISPDARGRPTRTRFATSKPSAFLVVGAGCSRVSVVGQSSLVQRCYVLEASDPTAAPVARAENLEMLLGPGSRRPRRRAYSAPVSPFD